MDGLLWMTLNFMQNQKLVAFFHLKLIQIHHQQQTLEKQQCTLQVCSVSLSILKNNSFFHQQFHVTLSPLTSAASLFMVQNNSTLQSDMVMSSQLKKMDPKQMMRVTPRVILPTSSLESQKLRKGLPQSYKQT